MRLRVALLPDSFKGSATAREIGDAMARGVRTAAAAAPVDVATDVVPFADGGEGTLDAIGGAWRVPLRTTQVGDALGRPVRARYAVSPESSIGVIEAAEANGLPLVSDVPLEPLRASTRGVGEIARSLLDEGCREILLCIGGSATTDGGAGILRALGARFVAADGSDLPEGGGALADLARIDLSGLDPRAAAVRWRIACDVTNPLLGPRGAARVFAPQKGAGPQDVARLERGLTRLADVLSAHTGRDVRDEPGTGAAGGIPAALVSLVGAETVPGGALVADALNVHDVLAAADLVITGEGRLDRQSLQGKVVATVRDRTPAPVPVMVVAGAVELSAAELAAAGLTTAISIANGPQSLTEMTASVLPAVEDTTAQLVGAFLRGRRAAVVEEQDA